MDTKEDKSKETKFVQDRMKSLYKELYAIENYIQSRKQEEACLKQDKQTKPKKSCSFHKELIDMKVPFHTKSNANITTLNKQRKEINASFIRHAKSTTDISKNMRSGVTPKPAKEQPIDYANTISKTLQGKIYKDTKKKLKKNDRSKSFSEAVDETLN